VSLRDFIRTVLDLEPVSPQLEIPRQGPARPSAARGKGEAGAKDEARQGGGKGMGGGAGGGAGSAAGFGLGAGYGDDDEHTHER
ncbi:MAG: hypothetical protein ABW187_07530, partial [Dokdonella sp.]